jgi:Mlc titration factor MtfA (ptsG expression regulator)
MQIISKLDVVFLWVWSSIILLIGIIGAVSTGNLAVLGLFAGVELIYLFFALKRPYRRTRAIKKPFPREWKEFLMEHSPFYRNIDKEAKQRFERDVRIFLNEFSIEGTRRRETDMDTKLHVAAGIATMLHGRPDWEPPFVDGVVIYPGNVFDRNYRSGKGRYAGMATHHAPLILTEGALEDSTRNPHDGYNVVFHETAHYFDFEDGQAEGIPAARMKPQKWYSWKNVFTREWQKVVRGRSFLRDYAGTNEAEFFAVAVESFFEKPWEMKEKNPELYDALKDFFNIDTYEILSK